jgi:uncharacterized protein
MRRKRICSLAIAVSCLASAAGAQGIAVPGPLKRDDPQLAQTMARIAVQVLDAGAVVTPEDRFRLQLAAGRYAEAVASLAQIRQGRPVSDPALLLNLRWEIYAWARLAEARDGKAFPAAFRDAAAETLRQVDGLTAYKILYSLGTPLGVMDAALDQALQAQAGRSSVDGSAVAALARAWLGDNAYHAFHDSLPAVTDADDAFRYIVQLDVPVRTPEGATVCAYVIRPRTAARLPALLNFSIYAERAVKLDDARITAAHGYAAVMGFTRGKACSPDMPVPVEHDGADADTLIDWIAAQPWSDGRVGMYGGSYDGFTQWAAAKHPPKALKAIMPSVSFSPGTDFPMEGNIGLAYAFPWPFYTTDNKAVDDATYYDDARWDRLQRTWYQTGRAYRDLDKIDGKPNPVFDGWLRHPAFDAYWQGLVPTDDQLRKLNIPVLTTTGYYDSGQIGALSYLLRRERLNPGAEQYLVIGPYEHHTGQLGTISPLGSTRPDLRGYHLDPVAQIDIIALRYAWFDYILKGAPKPAMLSGRANYEVMGANIWKHAASIAAMGSATQRFYLTARPARGGHALAAASGGRDATVVQNLDQADRSDVDRFAPHGPLIDQTLDDWPIVSKALNLANAITYVSAPFAKSPEVTGLFSGHLDFKTNKKDFDVAVTLFELTAQGEYFQLSYAWRRASFAKDRRHRELLTPGRRATIDFQAGRLTSRMFQPGSRLVVVLSLFKQPGEQINYGSGKSVSDETLADAGAPLKINWFADSYVDVPVAP